MRMANARTTDSKQHIVILSQAKNLRSCLILQKGAISRDVLLARSNSRALPEICTSCLGEGGPAMYYCPPYMPKFFIKTYGCQMNQRDSEQVAHSLVARGYQR